MNTDLVRGFLDRTRARLDLVPAGSDDTENVVWAIRNLQQAVMHLVLEVERLEDRSTGTP